MDSPPPRKPDAPTGLAEVERALSVLQGRHPEHERLRREDEERRRKRREEIEAVAREARRVALGRRLRIGGIAFAVLLVVGTSAFFARRELVRRTRLEQAADPYRGMGFLVVESSGRGEPAKIEASTSPGCLLATSTDPGARIKIAYGAGAIEGPSPVFGCLCAGAEVTVTSPLAPGEGLVLLRAEASTFGGSRAFAFLPFSGGTIAKTDAACAEASLDAWLDARRWTTSAVAPADGGAPAPRPVFVVDAPTSDAWFAAEPRRAILKSSGFKVATIVKPRAPFAFVEVPAESCLLVSPQRSSDVTSLRGKGGTLAAGPSPGNLLWCTSGEASILVQRDPEASTPAGEARDANGDVVVLVAPALRVAGLSGANELAERAGLSIRATGLAAADHAWSSKLLLLASSIPDNLVTVATGPDLASDPEARIVAVSQDKANSVSSDTPDGVFSYCDASLDRSTTALCVFSGSHKWRVAGGGEGASGLARAKHPFWLFTLQTVAEPSALKVEAQMLRLARRLRRDGFEPTTIEAVTELDKGAEVLGRANEDAMVVVALAPSEPWAFPYTDGPAWTLDDEPRVVPITPLERVKVVATAKTLPPTATRRSVVFRRTKR